MKESAKSEAIENGTHSKPIEELPLAERVKAAEAFDAFNGIQPGWLLDVKDTLDKWCMAKVLSVSNGEIRINYDGWSARFDETFKLTHRRLAPFRFFSKGYTGNIAVPHHIIIFTQDLLLEHRNRVEEILRTKFGCLATAFEVTQYLRGHLFIFVDFLMTSEQLEELPKVYEFLHLVITLIALWLEMFPKEFLTSYIESKQNLKLFYVDRNIALALCGKELTEMLQWFFFLCPRTALFFTVAFL